MTKSQKQMAVVAARIVAFLGAVGVLGVAIYYRDIVWMAAQTFFMVCFLPLVVLSALGVVSLETINALWVMPGVLKDALAELKAKLPEAPKKEEEYADLGEDDPTDEMSK